MRSKALWLWLIPLLGGPPLLTEAMSTAEPQMAELRLNVVDWEGNPTYFSLVLTDRASGAVYPPMQAQMRQAPDLWFQPQIYRRTGDQLNAPAGTYDVDIGRGPEYLSQRVTLAVSAGTPTLLNHTLSRWVRPEARGWYSGDHHLHGAGCSFTEQTTTGFAPDDLLPHIAGEGLNVGQILAWKPAFIHQSQFFSSTPDPSSTRTHVLKVDLELSGFASHQQGHYALLGLRDIVYPGSAGMSEWPTWNAPILQWAKAQEAVTAQVHSAIGLGTTPLPLPNYVVPPMNGIGAMEFFVNITQDLVDLYGTVNTDLTRELNAWYHVQNCGFAIPIAGETDFPCFGKNRVGQGRSYVKMFRRAEQPLNYNDWLSALRMGKSYVTEGGSHLMDFRVDGVDVGTGGLQRAGPGQVRVTCVATALLPATPPPPDPAWQGWSIERAREPNQQVAVEVIVNGLPIHAQMITADGTEAAIDTTIAINKSSWVAVRILSSSHTNAIPVIVGQQPIRASVDSAMWCLAAVDAYWAQKSGLIAPAEQTAANQAYQAARSTYQTIASESSVGPFANAVPYGPTCGSGPYQPTIGSNSMPFVGNTAFAITLSGAPPNVTPLLFLSQSKQALPFSGCTLLLGAPLLLGVAAPATSPAGATQLRVPISQSPALEGAEVYFQWVLPVPGAPVFAPLALSDGLDVHIASARTK